jgi:hypothetical protein
VNQVYRKLRVRIATGAYFPMPLGEHVVGVRGCVLTLPLGQPLRWTHRGDGL